jgi:hypothetical protein
MVHAITVNEPSAQSADSTRTRPDDTTGARALECPAPIDYFAGR